MSDLPDGRRSIPSVERFHIRVMPGDLPNRLNVSVKWRNSDSEKDIVLDSLRTRTLQVLVNLLRANRLIRSDEFMLLGEYLFVTLFGAAPAESGPRRLFMEAIKAPHVQSSNRRRLMQVSLEIGQDVNLIGSWPWEYLYVPYERNDPDTGFFVGDRMNYMLTRRLPLSDSKFERLENLYPPLKMLFVALSPTSEPPRGSASSSLALEPIEYQTVLDTLLTLRDSQDSSRIILRVLTEHHGPDGEPLPDNSVDETQATFDKFVGAVDEFDPHVIHIVGHGRYTHDEGGSPAGEIAFPNLDYTADWRSDQKLSNVLRDMESLRLVFLQTCESAETQFSPYQAISGLAHWLALRDIPAVVAMHFKIKTMLANEFAKSFYETLAKRTGIEVAMHAARLRISMAGDDLGGAQRGAFGFPVLYLRGPGDFLTPLEVEAPPVRTVVEMPASEAPRSPGAHGRLDDAYRSREAERWHEGPGTQRQHADSADDLAPSEIWEQR